MSTSGQDSNTSRKRGIRASRSKLDRAMLAAGFKTQTALARKIAEQEQLDAPPKDMVNRAFRQLPVEPMSLERIAEALCVPAYQLYLTSEDNQHQDSLPEPAPAAGEQAVIPGNQTTKPGLSWKRSAWLIIPLLIIVGVYFGQSAPVESTAPSRIQNRDISTLKLAIVASPGSFDSALKTELTTQFRSQVRLVENWPQQQLLQQDKLDWSKTLESDYVLTWETSELERYTQLQVYLINQQQRVLLYSDALLTASLDDIQALLGQRITHAFVNYLQSGEIKAETGLTLNTEALQQFMLAMQYFNQENTLANLSRTESRLQRSLRLDSDFARAQGALCTTLLRKASLSSDIEMIADTKEVCQKGVQIAAVEESLQGMANYVRGHDQLDESMHYYEQILQFNPGFTDALYGKSKVLEKQAVLQKQPDLFAEAIDVLDAAIDLEPDGWRGYFIKSHLLYRLGKPSEAIAALEIGVSKEANFNTLNNIGTMYFCQGEMPKAKEAFLQVTELERDPSWIIEHQLASLFQFSGETDKAVEYAERGMALLDTEQVDGHFDPWITKALAYQAHGNQQVAHESFAKALKIAERLRLSGKDPGNTDIQLVYIKVADAYIDNKVISDPVRQTLLDELNEIADKATTPNAMVRLMLSYVMLNHYEPARPIYQRIGAMCPGFVKDPILAPLAT
ncbi:hypothetical protein [Lacimicrobium alkaliphilum]|uniref:Tetratricopeptide repeat protein n=1 Tax=Lacimicrobium alkaliphilum TaxID=1526571 RepID=A0ABQ1RDA5_9ALTE|nr:hypothetical protein [Lacimicrobium alkaliphilum]GGD63029.1 hypothetical protein GCM10011357_17900 [Lacimicrobium alkaliphilum]